MKIGIFWFYSDRIIGIAHEFNSNEKDSIGLIDSKYTHVEYWERIKADIPELRYMEYDEVQRGRVIFDINKNKLNYKFSGATKFVLPPARKSANSNQDAHYPFKCSR